MHDSASALQYTPRRIAPGDRRPPRPQATGRRASIRLFYAALVLGLAAGCTPPVQVRPDTGAHLERRDIPTTVRADIPPPVTRSLALPAPRALPRAETYSVVVNNVKVQDLLFALARDAKLNVDLHPGLSGNVTLNAIDQTLPQLLERIAKQVDLRYELDGPNLAVMPDSPFLRTYKVDYVNLSRDTESTVSVATQIATAGSSISGSGSGSGSAGGSNSSSAKVTNVSRNRFWETLIQNVKDLLRETDKVFPEGAGETTIEQNRSQTVAPSEGLVGRALSAAARALENNGGTGASGNNGLAADLGVSRTDATTVKVATYREAAAVIVNPETGVISVRATARQHEKVQEFLDRVVASAKRQVLIEATIAEVELSQNYQQGIDLSKINLGGYGFTVVQGAAGSLTAPGASIFELGYDSKGGNFSGSIRLLESFGNVRVLSSPKLSVLNNQTAVLKVVDNSVYFTIEADTNQNQNQTVTTFTTTVHTVPIGLVLNVTPQISEGDQVLLNLRPSLSRIVGQAADPNPALRALSIQNNIPIVRSREIESVLRVSDGNIAVMGGLMEDLLDGQTDSTPGLSSLPGLGALFQNRDDTRRKTELVIFLRPTIIRDASLQGDFSRLAGRLPDGGFFDKRIGPDLFNLERLRQSEPAP